MNDYDDMYSDGSRISLSFSATNPEDEAVQSDSKEYIMNQVLKLPFTEAQVIILKYYRDMKHDDIARLMDMSRSSVKRSLISGMARLGKILQQ